MKSFRSLHGCCDALPRVLPVLLQILLVLARNYHFDRNIVINIMSTKDLHYDVSHQSATCKYHQKFVEHWRSSPNFVNDLCLDHISCRSSPKSHCLYRVSKGVLCDDAVRGLANKHCLLIAIVRGLVNLQYSSDHRRVGEAKNPGPEGEGLVEITVGV